LELKTLGKNAIRGVGGTRNCDWWFTDSAVLIDTAGRYARIGQGKIQSGIQQRRGFTGSRRAHHQIPRQLIKVKCDSRRGRHPQLRLVVHRQRGAD
jgi:hypothetical protein